MRDFSIVRKPLTCARVPHARQVACVALFVFVMVSVVPAQIAVADDMAFVCRRIGPFAAENATFHYTGAATGSLVAKGAFGNVTLPATRSRRAGFGPQGATAISATGTVPALMPERGAIEACLKPLANPTSDPDIAALHLLGCQSQVPARPPAVPVVVTISITTGRVGTDVLTEITVKRQPVAAAAGAGKLLQIESEFTCDVVR